MIFEVCAIVLTIVFGMLGIYLLVVLRSVQKLTEEARISVTTLNQDLPQILADVKESVNGLKVTTEAVQDKVEHVTLSVNRITSSPVVAAAKIVGSLSKGIKRRRMRQKRV